mmetsp:Transcript_84971/g.263968  ORF Transcript_84971/g.263968 Transcript_84971/m.263968 type:complete len:244 (+) Transcript_84971:163-894(+)
MPSCLLRPLGGLPGRIRGGRVAVLGWRHALSQLDAADRAADVDDAVGSAGPSLRESRLRAEATHGVLEDCDPEGADIHLQERAQDGPGDDVLEGPPARDLSQLLAREMDLRQVAAYDEGTRQLQGILGQAAGGVPGGLRLRRRRRVLRRQRSRVARRLCRLRHAQGPSEAQGQGPATALLQHLEHLRLEVVARGRGRAGGRQRRQRGVRQGDALDEARRARGNRRRHVGRRSGRRRERNVEAV